MGHLVGIDGGGTRTTVVVADAGGQPLARYAGAAGLVDPRAPAAAAAVLVSAVAEASRLAGVRGPAAALCAGLAGVGDPATREVVRAALAGAGVAERVRVATDSETALEGAFASGAGILLIAGTGSIAYGRGEDGRTERCGGWGMVVGDEGSGYAIGRAALTAALRAVDGRGTGTRLLPMVMERLGVDEPRQIATWAGRAAKAEIAALVPEVIRLAEGGDAPALEILRGAAREQALHAAALIERLAPWSEAPRVVLLGGVFAIDLFRDLVTRAMTERIPGGFRVREPETDAVGGAVRMAASLAGGMG
jgi:glucosamine kinase